MSACVDIESAVEEANDRHLVGSTNLTSFKNKLAVIG